MSSTCFFLSQDFQWREALRGSCRRPRGARDAPSLDQRFEIASINRREIRHRVWSTNQRNCRTNKSVAAFKRQRRWRLPRAVYATDSWQRLSDRGGGIGLRERHCSKRRVLRRFGIRSKAFSFLPNHHRAGLPRKTGFAHHQTVVCDCQ